MLTTIYLGVIMKKTMFVLGATGFVGSEVVREALKAGWAVKALARSQKASDRVAGLGSMPILGDASDASSWKSELRNTDVLFDLVQPEIPVPFRVKAVRKISEKRQALTKGILDALSNIAEDERPLYFSISGTDDLEPDSNRMIGSESKTATSPSGFGHIGIPVRRIVERSGVDAVYVYLGTVYGPGKTFAQTIIPQLAQGKWKLIGGGANHIPIVHVEDVARGLVHLASLDRALTVGKSFVLADASRTTAKELFTGTAEMMGAKAPGSVPKFLASLSAGKIVIETLTHDLIADPTGLTKTGFAFKYKSYREGMPPTLEKLGYTTNAKRN
jgi:nucleoside-diphosphate-sugar epimerase